MAFKDRVTRLVRVKASELVPSPRNWRRHPESQAAAMRGVLEEIGIAGAAIARELPDGKLMLIDGHLRAELDPDAVLPVLVLDVDEDEADKILATHDVLTGLAETDSDALAELLSDVNFSNEAILKMLADVDVTLNVDDVDLPASLGEDHPPEMKQLTVYLDEADYEAVQEAMSIAKRSIPEVKQNVNGAAFGQIARGFLYAAKQTLVDANRDDC